MKASPAVAPAASRRGGMFPFLSLVSGGSLVVIGALSSLFSVFFWSWAGLAISLVLLALGVFELALRKRLLESGDARAGRLMGRNQILLAMSVTLYAASQVWGIDAAWGERMAEAPMVASALELYPKELREELVKSLPLFVVYGYGAGALVVWLGCWATALYYWSETRKRT